MRGQITYHNVGVDEISTLLKATSGNTQNTRLWVNSNSVKRVYVSLQVNLGVLNVQVFSIDFEAREAAEEFLNGFEFDVEYIVTDGDEEE